VARLDDDGSGAWLPLVAGTAGLDAAAGFASQGELLIKSRQAADHAGGTRMDRPEWITGDAASATLWCALTGNTLRGTAGHPGVDAANPRAANGMGQILQWKERGGVTGTRFDWTHFVLAGDPAAERPEARGNVRGDAFGNPDGLWLDARGVLWIQTDVSNAALGRGDHRRLGNNMMLAADPASGEVRRFLTGPVGCEVTGVSGTPDLRTLFVNIQHPGETPGDRSNPDNPRSFSNWPDYAADGRPRSATVVIRRKDGGVIGT
jgi:secreted PhoX family phosphatase